MSYGILPDLAHAGSPYSQHLCSLDCLLIRGGPLPLTHYPLPLTPAADPLSFAIWAYAVKLVNSVAVLLVVNCSSLSDLQTKAMAGVSASE